MMLPACRKELAMWRSFEFSLLFRHSLIMLSGKGMQLLSPVFVYLKIFILFSYFFKKSNSKPFSFLFTSEGCQIIS